ILVYHRVAGPRRDPQWLDVRKGNFGAQLDQLLQSARTLPLGEFEARRRAGTLPPRAVAVTFDDGYADNLLAAVPLLERHGVPATVFVTAGMIGGDREFWWDDAERIAFASQVLVPPVPGLDVAWSASDGAHVAADPATDRWTVQEPSDPTPRHRLYRALCAALKPLPTPERERRLAAWRAWAGVPDAARETHRALTRHELVTLSRRPGIGIGAHTMTHPSLALLTPGEQLRELRDSRTWLEDVIRSPVRSVAYPFGTSSDVSEATEHAAVEAGFDVALANEPAAAWRWSRRSLVPRVLVRDWDGPTFAQQVNAWFDA
ncbi:MAG: polysaccharide deacetylase family protein, partial [Gemmatimonadales bacterium]